jgi:exodeoxyribonuclease III
MASGAMGFSLATWNINSVRLRIGLVEKLIREHAPDIICLQETKCPQGQFPSSPLKALGYGHIAEFGQKGYHGVAIVSRFPFVNQLSRRFCGKDDCRHVSAVFGSKEPVIVHNLYVPAGGDETDPEINEKFDHKLKFIAEMQHWSSKEAQPEGHHAIAVGDLNVAPLETDVWSHQQLLKVVSHTPIETEGFKKVQSAGRWVDVMRQHIPPDQKLFTWWSYRARDWELSDRGRRLDHIWASEALGPRCTKIKVLKEARGWTQPSDHVPVIGHFDLKI